MVRSKTYRLSGSGQYLQPEEVEEIVRDGRGREMETRWEKMSKSKHNGIDPADVIKQYGADTVRLYILFKVERVCVCGCVCVCVSVCVYLCLYILSMVPVFLLGSSRG